MYPQISVYLFKPCPVRLWRLTSKERCRRVFAKHEIVNFITNLKQLPKHHSIIMLREDYLYDDRVIDGLIQQPNSILTITRKDETIPVAAHVDHESARETLARLEKDELPPTDAAGPNLVGVAELTSAYMSRLRKFDQPFILPISAADQPLLEEHLFSWSYKGVTDLVTKWVWPGPARHAVGFCVKHGFTPNQVTLVGFFLALLAGLLFYNGCYGTGLFAGWLMTFLDTVDGKLARVTVKSSKFGHLFDHGIDLIHPPLWYLAWGAGLAGYGIGSLSPAAWQLMLWLILGGYLGGRLVEAVFTLYLGRFGIFCWQPRDSYFRLITGRRNPNMILLTLSWLLGRPDIGLWAVALWTSASSIYLSYRLYLALQSRKNNGPLKSWFTEIDPKACKEMTAVKIFTRKPTILPDGSRG